MSEKTHNPTHTAGSVAARRDTTDGVKILIVEDDTSFGLMLQNWASKNGFDAELASSVEKAKARIEKGGLQLVITDLRLPDGDGIMLLTWMQASNKITPVIMMTGYGDVTSAVAAMKLGASDYLEKPINPSILKQKIEQALQQKIEPAKTIKKEENPRSVQAVYGKSRASTEFQEYIRVVAPTRMSVLILGESGTGKEYAARMIHDLSRRKDAPFIAVDCGVLSRELAPSELFGHVKGSFTSAIANKKGVFEQANGGTVFLDEIENLPYEVQVQLLRALQELKIRPVGSEKDIEVDIRIIVATNENLQKSISEGRFREDLYHRLNEFSLTIPPLRERTDDIPLYANHFLAQANAELEKEVKSISPEAMHLLEKQHWSGNLRELRNVIRRAVLFAQSDEITPETLPAFAPKMQAQPQAEEAAELGFGSPENEKKQIETALKIAKGNKAAAARMLKIDRKTLYNKMEKYQM